MREDFCGACIAGAAALVGAGTTGKSISGKKNSKKKRVIFWIGVGITLLSIIVCLYILCIKKCSECQ